MLGREDLVCRLERCHSGHELRCFTRARSAGRITGGLYNSNGNLKTFIMSSYRATNGNHSNEAFYSPGNANMCVSVICRVDKGRPGFSLLSDLTKLTMHSALFGFFSFSYGVG